MLVEKLVERVHHKDPRIELEGLEMAFAYLWGKPQESFAHHDLGAGGVNIILATDGRGKSAPERAERLATVDVLRRADAEAPALPAG